MESRKRRGAPKREERATQTPSPPSKLDRTLTVHPRVSVDEDQMVKELAEQANQSETAVWSDCTSLGLLIVLVKKGPNALGLYGGRWSAKELAQEIRRRILNELIDFQYEQGELPALLRDYMTTLKTLAEQRQQFPVAPGTLLSPETLPATAEDDLVFGTGADADSVNQSLGGMGFQLNLKALGDGTE
jgi:hypothetical protein